MTRQFVFRLTVLLLLLISPLALSEDNKRKQVVLTFDDLVIGGPDRGLERIKEAHEKTLAILQKYEVPAIGFVNDYKLYKNDEYEQRRAILASWLEAGMELGNHTYSHPDLHKISLDEYIADLERGEKTTNELLAEHGERIRYFRHPYLHTGRSLEVKEKFEKYLSEHGYTIAPVTFDNADYIYNLVYSNLKNLGDTESMQQLGKEYIDYMEKIVVFYEQASQHLFSRQIPHIFLLHANEINADYLDELIEMLIAHEYQFVSLADAIKDPAYKSEDKYVGKAGTSWLYRWEFSLAERTFNWRAHPQASEWILEAYRKGVKGK